MSEKRARKAATAMIAELDQAELAVRLLEIGCKMKRPPGSTGQEALEQVRESARRGDVPTYIVEDFEAIAEAALRYFGERVAALQRVQ